MTQSRMFNKVVDDFSFVFPSVCAKYRAYSDERSRRQEEKAYISFKGKYHNDNGK